MKHLTPNPKDLDDSVQLPEPVEGTGTEPKTLFLAALGILADISLGSCSTQNCYD